MKLTFLAALANKLEKIIQGKAIKSFLYDSFCVLTRKWKAIVTVENITYDLDFGESIDIQVFFQKFERDIVKAIERFTQTNTVVFDIGANIGAHTLRFAKMTGPNGRVYAFEPTNFAYSKLLRNISLNAFSNIYPAQIVLANKNQPFHEIEFRSSWRTDRSDVRNISKVDFVRLDDWCASHDIERIDILKIDVDGNEFPVFDGAREVLKRNLPIIFMEIVAPHFNKSSENPLEILMELGYRFWDSITLTEYKSLSEIRSMLPLEDGKMTRSLNVIAATRDIFNASL